MSRSGYDEAEDPLAYGRWRAQVRSATRGKRGQKFLLELRDALDAMPVKALIANKLESDGEFCALGVVGQARGIDLSKLDPDEPESVAAAFDIADALAREIVYINDEAGPGFWADPETPEQRWLRVRAWVERQIVNPAGTLLRKGALYK